MSNLVLLENVFGIELFIVIYLGDVNESLAIDFFLMRLGECNFYLIAHPVYLELFLQRGPHPEALQYLKARLKVVMKLILKQVRIDQSETDSFRIRFYLDSQKLSQEGKESFLCFLFIVKVLHLIFLYQVKGVLVQLSGNDRLLRHKRSASTCGIVVIILFRGLMGNLTRVLSHVALECLDGVRFIASEKLNIMIGLTRICKLLTDGVHLKHQLVVP
jgi:hypothetical protein